MLAMPHLLERRVELKALETSVEQAASGHGSTVLVFGEAGIGKTSLVRAFLTAHSGNVKVLAGACEDLSTPRTLGPLRDAARSTGGPLAQALAGPDPDLVFTAMADELAAPPRPTVLVIEDAHWADGATLDVLRYVGRRVHDLPAMLVLTYRDDGLGPHHPLRRVLGALGGAEAIRLRLARLTPGAVTRLAADSTVDPADLFRLTGGNPFFVTEALAAPGARVPLTVLDAVLARMNTLTAPARAGLEQLAVVPSGVELGLLRALLDDITPLAEAEQLGMLEVRGDVVAFRHELARCAVVESLPASVRLELHGRVLQALLERVDPDPFRVLHHALEAGQDDAVVEHGTAAAQEATRAGAHRQAASSYAQVLAHGRGLPLARRAVIHEAIAWALSNSNELHAAADAAAAAVEERASGDERALAHALVTLTRQQWLTEQPAAARRSAEQALTLARTGGDTVLHALARLCLGGLLVLVDREEEALPVLDGGLEMAERVGAVDIAALCHNYRGSARLQLGHLAGRDELLRSLALALDIGHHEFVLRAFYNLAEGMWRLGEYAEACDYLDQADAYGSDREFLVHSYMFEARRYRLLAMQGAWAAAEAGLRELLDGQDDPGMIGRETIPILARVLVRQGHPGAAEQLARASQHAERADVLEWLVPTGLAHIEEAWLTGSPPRAGRYPELLLQRTNRPGTDVWRGELLRWLRRLGYPVEPFPGCPKEYAAGIRGDWRAAAAVWQRAGFPYERALELAESGEPEPTLEALVVLERLGAKPAAAIVRRRLRGLGVTRLPRGPKQTTRANPAGLTVRQVEILRLVAAGLSNAEIADELVVSIRTVDHHVSAVLQKLGVHTRHEAAARSASLVPPD